MPTFKANDGVSLYYETHGDSGHLPLVLVRYLALPQGDPTLTFVQAARLHWLGASIQAQH